MTIEATDNLETGISVGGRIINTIRYAAPWGTGIGGLMRGMTTLPQGYQELSVVTDKVGRPPR